MSETLSAIVKTGGDFITRAAAGGTIAIGVTGDLTLTPPSGQRVRLTHLSTTSGSQQSGMSVLIGGVDITGVVSIKGDAPVYTGTLSIGSYQAYTAGSPPNANHSQFTGSIDEPVIIRKNAGNTTVTIYYGYEFGL